MTATATLAYTSSTHAARVTDRIARVAAAGRIAAERRAAEVRAGDARLARLIRLAETEADLVARFGEDAEYGLKIVSDQGKWRTRTNAFGAAWHLSDREADVEAWVIGTDQMV
jgi:hypothetical protein